MAETIGVQTTSEGINWRYLNEERVDDPTISALVKEAISIYIKKEKNLETNFESNILNIYIDTFNKYLKDNKIKYEFNRLILEEDNILKKIELSLVNAQFPVLWYIINYTNKMFKIKLVNNAEQIITIPVGNYNVIHKK